MTGYLQTRIYTTTTYALANTTIDVPDLPRPVSYPYTASPLLLPLEGPDYINRVRSPARASPYSVRPACACRACRLQDSTCKQHAALACSAAPAASTLSSIS